MISTRCPLCRKNGAHQVGELGKCVHGIPMQMELRTQRSQAISGGSVPQVFVPKGGCGTELKKILLSIGITDLPGCSCNATMAKMNAEGPEWCEKNIELISSYMAKEADKRGWMKFIPFKNQGARVLVKLAIDNYVKSVSE